MTAKKNKYRPYYIWGGLGLLALVTAVGVRSVRKFVDGFDFFYKSFTIKNVSITSLQLEMIFRYELINNSNLSLKIKDYNAQFYLSDGSQYLFVGESKNPVNINLAANSRPIIEIPFVISLMSIPWGRIPKLLEGQPVKFKLVSSFNVAGITVREPFEDNFVLPGAAIAAINTIKSLLIKK